MAQLIPHTLALGLLESHLGHLVQPDIDELEPGQRLRGIIHALWYYEGLQVDVGAQWDG